jgi:outer membrane protein OmpA-like peptidoglycan-associated protein
MESQIIRKEAGINPQNGDTVLQYFEVQPDSKSLSYLCDVSYLVEQIEKEEYFYVYGGGEKIEIFINHEPNGEKFVQTKKDKTSKDNLWNLPDFEHSKDDYIRKGTPKPKEVISEVIKYQDKPYNLKNLMPYLLPALALGLLLPILYCWLSRGCFCSKPITISDTVYVHDTVPRHCPTADIKALNAVIHFKYDKIEYDNLKGEDTTATLMKCLNLLKSDKKNFYVELAGYADYKGGVDYNEELAAQRILKIANYFLKNGVDSTQIPVQQEFSNNYARRTNDPRIQAQDRKVEIRIYGLEKK